MQSNIATYYLTAPEKHSKELAAPFYGRNIAHRGLHSEDNQTPENSLSAFRAAAEAGYGIEFDLQMTKDGQVYATLSSDELKFLLKITNAPSPAMGKGATLNNI